MNFLIERINMKKSCLLQGCYRNKKNTSFLQNVETETESLAYESIPSLK